jgi:hypothetical protein
MTAILDPQTSAHTVAHHPAPDAPAQAVRVEAAPPPAPIVAPTPATLALRPAMRPGPVRAALAALAARPVLRPSGVRLVGLAMVGLFWAALALEPPADGPDPVITGWLALMVNVQTIALLAGAAGFAMGRRWALSAGVVFAAITAVSIAMCPASGHHVISGWWYGQVALGAALLLVPALALALTRSGQR